ncbi:MAG: glycosyltransferase [Deltaproteobacteria bacterium]|nr:glycosyltransferase [Deltaproteobacteria bacterium]
MTDKNYNDKYPRVSVIVPVKDSEKTIEKLIAALLAQDYPADHTQIIIVDNGSQDHSVEIIKKYPVIFECENKVASSYAARNKGLSVADGEIIAFTDADCIPQRDWLSVGVRALDKEKADMAGGRVEFIFSERKSAAEYFDSLNILRNDRFIHNKIGAVTANLFVRTGLFGRIGSFPEVQSGGDIGWTGRALDEGHSLIYVPEAIVYHPTRNFVEILKKGWRYGTGILLNLKKRSWWFLKGLYLINRLLIPVPAKVILKSFIAAKSYPEMRGRRLAIWGISYLYQISLLAGLVSSVFRRDLKTSDKK